MKIKFIDSNYDPETGKSWAKIMTDYGEFYGESKLHPEDAAIASSFCGCEYAEIRAIEKYFKYRIKLLNAELKGIKDVLNVLERKNGYDPQSIEARTIRKQYYIKNKQKHNLIKRLNSLHSSLLQKMERREQIISYKLLKNKKEEGDENLDGLDNIIK